MAKCKVRREQFLRGCAEIPLFGVSSTRSLSSNFENNWDEKIIHLSISADTQFVLIASKEKVEMERIEDLQPVLKYRPKSEEDIQAVACLSKLGEDVQLLAIVLPESIHMLRSRWIQKVQLLGNKEVRVVRQLGWSGSGICGEPKHYFRFLFCRWRVLGFGRKTER